MPTTPTPDGVRYLALAQGQAVPKPFNVRVLLPLLARTDVRRWRAASILGTLLLCLGTAFLCPDWKTGLAAALMALALPSTRFSLRHPILVDLPALGLAASSAALFHHEIYWAAFVPLFAAALCRETTPLFVAAFSWTLWPLVALAIPVMLYLTRKEGPDPIPTLAWIQQQPFKAGWQFHKGLYLSGMMLAPWGGAIVGLANLNEAAIASLILGYGQLLVATDTVRLYQWAAP
ncbi:MAG TPA: hypothetical protein VGK43_03580, partial [Solirubrobacterales bacterium]